ncbi:nuclear transport factor 2 family protein [Thalassotalea marina]|uniref:Nuclear transport factor 2 family protein n=1 Tax=Thalassotalea marina TaxID=1673741 RepID=A0A919BP62_9GAMM|nr:nuclear transport factor 2 family protein [Thalassotalea marina]GHG02909.1 hypothetical protein GCM10017161_34900 [Thalassotalea marina]
MTDNQQIEALLAEYFDGLYQADAAKLAKVFHPNAYYSCTTGGELLHLSMQQYFNNVRQRTSPASLGQERKDKIIVIDLVGESTALAKVQCQILPRSFTDFLSLLKIDGRWQIISKVFHYTEINT